MLVSDRNILPIMTLFNQWRRTIRSEAVSIDDLHLASNRPSALSRRASILGLEDVCGRTFAVLAPRRSPTVEENRKARRILLHWGIGGRICMAYSTFQFPAEGHTMFVKD